VLLLWFSYFLLDLIPWRLLSLSLSPRRETCVLSLSVKDRVLRPKTISKSLLSVVTGSYFRTAIWPLSGWVLSKRSVKTLEKLDLISPRLTVISDFGSLLTLLMNSLSLFYRMELRWLMKLLRVLRTTWWTLSLSLLSVNLNSSMVTLCLLSLRSFFSVSCSSMPLSRNVDYMDPSVGLTDMSLMSLISVSLLSNFLFSSMNTLRRLPSMLSITVLESVIMVVESLMLRIELLWWPS